MAVSLPEFRLDEVPDQQVFVLEHVFDTSADVLFEAFTSAEMLVQWFGPEGWTVPRHTAEIDPRVGGAWKFTMVNVEDPQMTSPSDAVFVSLVPEKLIEGVQTLPGQNGSEYFYMRVELVAQGDKTNLRIAQGPLAEEFHEQAAAGWTSSYRKLEKLLAA